MLIDIDLENNPVDDIKQVHQTVESKKDLLVFNLKLSPVTVKAVKIEDFGVLVGMTYFSNGVLYRSRRVYVKIKQHN